MAPIAVGTTADLTSRLFTSSISTSWLVAVPVGMWAKASISLLSELGRGAGEAQPVGNADRRVPGMLNSSEAKVLCPT